MSSTDGETGMRNLADKATQERLKRNLRNAFNMNASKRM
jgi:hypothetical protein